MIVMNIVLLDVPTYSDAEMKTLCLKLSTVLAGHVIILL